MIRSCRTALSFCIAALAVPTCLFATSYVMVDDADLLRQAEAVVDAEIVSAAPSSASGRPITEYTVRVERLLAGSVAGTTLVVRVPGGFGADGIGFRAYGAPRFVPGERAILFLVPRDDAFGVLHLAMGAFHRVESTSGPAVAVRELSPADEVVLPGVKAHPRRHHARDFEAFAAWLSDRSRGEVGPADYFVAEPPGLRVPPAPRDLPGLGEKFTLFQVSGFNLRWFVFDSGGSVSWHVHEDGQPSVPGGGFGELQAALDAWNDDELSWVDYAYSGTTPLAHGLDYYDGLNVVLPDDPNDEIAGTFQCGTGGVLAIGGPWFDSTARDTFDGVEYIEILSADVVMNDGIECLAAGPCFATYVEGIYGHELGHTLGIGHACGDASSPSCASDPLLADALMRATAHGDCRGAVLNGDDRAAVRHLYDTGADCTGDATLELAAETVLGEEVFEICRTLTAGAGFAVAAGGDVTFRAGSLIVLADGFSVASGGSFAAEIDPALRF